MRQICQCYEYLNVTNFLILLICLCYKFPKVTEFLKSITKVYLKNPFLKDFEKDDFLFCMVLLLVQDFVLTGSF